MISNWCYGMQIYRVNKSITVHIGPRHSSHATKPHQRILYTIATKIRPIILTQTHLLLQLIITSAIVTIGPLDGIIQVCTSTLRSHCLVDKKTVHQAAIKLGLR